MARSVTEEFKELYHSLKNKIYQPVYLLHGEESYYIDKLVDVFENQVLNEQEREFNLDVLYGKDVTVSQLISTAKRYPMSANHHVVIVREAQTLQKINDLASYVAQPLKSTLLVIVHKHKTIDGRKSLAKAVKKHGVIFHSKKLYDNQIPDWIQTFLSGHNYPITPKASMMITEYVGNDLSNISNELQKIMINLPEKTKITDRHVEQNIGISKDYNIFELQNAIGNRDKQRAYRIADYFGKNQKSFPLLRITSTLYFYVTKLMLIHKSKSRDPGEISHVIGMHPFLAKDYISAARNYSFGQLAEMIRILKEYDLKTKGINNASTDDSELLKEMIYKILR
ncbi:MAG: DNA polymerase III subunit delta [Bacteroidales bacterium]